MSEDSEREAMRAKILDICNRMVDRVHGTEMTSLSPDQMRSLIFVVREAWYLSNDRFGELTVEEFEKLQAMAEEEHDEEAADSDEDDPFGLRDQ